MIYDGLFKTPTEYFQIISSTIPSHCMPSIFFSMLSYRSNGSYKVFVKIKLKRQIYFLWLFISDRIDMQGIGYFRGGFKTK